MLGLERVGVTDNFFELGGDSILAMKLVGSLRHAGFRRLTTGAVFNYPTVAELSRALEEEVRYNNHSVYLQRAGTRPPVFCMHPFQGKVESYRDLTQHALKDHPVIGFEARWLGAHDFIEESIESIAREYVQEILLRHFPANGCFVLGWSWGGVLVYELARQLSEYSKIYFLGVIDVYEIAFSFNDYVERVVIEDQQKLEMAFREAISSSAIQDMWRYLLSVITDRQVIALLSYYSETADQWNDTKTNDILNSHEYRTFILFNRIYITQKYRARKSDIHIKPWLNGSNPNGVQDAINWSCYSENVDGVDHQQYDAQNHYAVQGIVR